MGNKKIYLCLTFCLFGLMACVRKEAPTKEVSGDTYLSVYNCDSVIYKFPDETTVHLLKIINKKKVSHCILICSDPKDEYSFFFPDDNKFVYCHQDSALFNKTRTFLNLHGKFYPIIHETDYFFGTPRDSLYTSNKFKSYWITVNSRGKIIDCSVY